MKSVCFYFQVHQPFRMHKYTVFDIGKNKKYFDEKKNKEILEKVAKKCYLPANKILLDTIQKANGAFKVAFSITGTALEQFALYCPEVIESFQALAHTGCVEFLGETYYHSLAALYNQEEWKQQVRMHTQKIRQLFGKTPSVFRNTELIYNNDIAQLAEKEGFIAILAEGADSILSWRSPNFVYQPQAATAIRLLLKNYKLSDDIAFRFSDKNWTEWPLSAEKFVSWIKAAEGETVNLFLDYETFGEHQWEDTGIFTFLKNLPSEMLKQNITFKTPSELALLEPIAAINVPNLTSWADVERDLSAWQGNKMQQSALSSIYALQQKVKAANDQEILATWRKLQTSDHFYYMCTKWFADGDVHKYFNPYDSPYDSFLAFMNILNDFTARLKTEETQKKEKNFFQKLSLLAKKIKA